MEIDLRRGGIVQAINIYWSLSTWKFGGKTNNTWMWGRMTTRSSLVHFCLFLGCHSQRTSQKIGANGQILMYRYLFHRIDRSEIFSTQPGEWELTDTWYVGIRTIHKLSSNIGVSCNHHRGGTTFTIIQWFLFYFKFSACVIIVGWYYIVISYNFTTKHYSLWKILG